MSIYETTKFGKEEIKYLEVIINSSVFKKDYPFIKKIFLSDNFDRYVSIIYIDLVVDFEKYSEFLNIPIDEFWYKQLKSGKKLEFFSMGSLLEYDPVMLRIDDLVKLKFKIETEILNIYKTVVPKDKQLTFYEVQDPEFKFNKIITINRLIN
jgi:hypothetical protein